MAWKCPKKSEYKEMIDLSGLLVRPDPGTLLHKVAQLPFADPEEVLTCNEARRAIDGGRKPKDAGPEDSWIGQGLIPRKFFDAVCKYAEGCG